jgi:hypothetical protein
MAKIYDIADYADRRRPTGKKEPGLAKIFNIADHPRWQSTHEPPHPTPTGPGTFTP